MNERIREPEIEQWLEDVTKHTHIVIPIAGAVLIFMLACIAITVA
jgi:hypothetical protein